MLLPLQDQNNDTIACKFLMGFANTVLRKQLYVAHIGKICLGF